MRTAGYFSLCRTSQVYPLVFLTILDPFGSQNLQLSLFMPFSMSLLNYWKASHLGEFQKLKVWTPISKWSILCTGIERPKRSLWYLPIRCGFKIWNWQKAQFCTRILSSTLCWTTSSFWNQTSVSSSKTM